MPKKRTAALIVSAILTVIALALLVIAIICAVNADTAKQSQDAAEQLFGGLFANLGLVIFLIAAAIVGFITVFPAARLLNSPVKGYKIYGICDLSAMAVLVIATVVYVVVLSTKGANSNNAEIAAVISNFIAL